MAEAASTRPDAPALTFKDVTLTYAQLWRGVGGFGATLRGLGLCRGDRVAVYLEKLTGDGDRALRHLGGRRGFRPGQPSTAA